MFIHAVVQRTEEAVQAKESTIVLEYEAKEVSNEFRRRTSQLYKLLQSSTLQAPQRVPYLRQLLLRLNFNQFMEREAAGTAKAAKAAEETEQKADILVLPH